MRSSALAILLSITCVPPVVLLGQNAAQILGLVVDTHHRPVAGIVVDIENSDFTENFHAEVKSNEQGKFLVTGLNPGNYVLFPYDLGRNYVFTGNSFQSKQPARVVIPSEGGNVDKTLMLSLQAGILNLRFVSQNKGLPLASADVVLCHTAELLTCPRFLTQR